MSKEVNLSSRWTTDRGSQLTQEILKSLRKGNSAVVAQIAGTHEGRADLRGFSFPKPMETGQSIGFRGYKVDLVSGTEGFEHLAIDDIDFSHADLSESIWRRCSFSNCVFHNSRLDDAAFFDCRISESTFVNSSIIGCVLGGHMGNRSGELIDSTFKGGKFKNVIFSFPRLVGCTFDCDITNVDFDGSQIACCTFTGKLNKVIFRRRYRPSSTDILKPELIPENNMMDVDFSESYFEDVDFRGGLDLSRCILPKNQDVFLLTDAPAILEEVKSRVSSQWQGEERRIGIGFVDQFFHDFQRDGQTHYVVVGEMLREVWDPQLGDKFVSLVKQVRREKGRSQGAVLG